jgi:nucleotide-binding universal stress UspA family protein
MPANILVPVDDSPQARRAVEQAVELARKLGAGVTLMTVVVTPALSLAGLEAAQAETIRAGFRTAGERLLATLRSVAESAGVPAETRQAEGVPAEVILAEAGKGYLMIVMGSRGAGLEGQDRALLGSVSDRVLRQSPVPVLLVPHR